MIRPGAGDSQQTGAERHSAEDTGDYTTLAAHLDALAELSTVSQFADYLFWQSGTADMQRRLLAHVPRSIRGAVWSEVIAIHRRQRTGGW